MTNQPHTQHLQPPLVVVASPQTISLPAARGFCLPWGAWLGVGCPSSAVAAALPRSRDASLKPRCTRMGLWPPRHLAVLHVKSLLQPLLSNRAIFGLPAREPRSAHRSSADNPIHTPAGSPATSKPLLSFGPTAHRPSGLIPLLVPGGMSPSGAAWGSTASPAPGDGLGGTAALPWHEPRLFRAAPVCLARSSWSCTKTQPPTGVTRDARVQAKGRAGG